MVIVAAAADMEPKQWRRESQGSSLSIFSCPCARWGPRLGLCETLGRWRGRGDEITPMTFVTASGQDGAGSPWGAGGEARPPPPQRMWPGCIPVGFGSDPGWGGGGERAWAEETVVRSALAAWRGRDDCLRAGPLPHIAYSCGSRGKAPGGTLLTGCDGCWWWRFGALFSYLPFSLQSSYVRWQFPSVGVAVICESLRAAGLSKKRERVAGPQR